MEKDSLELSVKIPVSPEQLYKDWLDSDAHTNFTGGEAIIDSSLNGSYTAWDNYISGKNLELEPHTRILQSWRTTEFDESDEDSMLEITFEPAGKACILHLKHWNIPEGQGSRYKTGWEEHYFDPMKEYYS